MTTSTLPRAVGSLGRQASLVVIGDAINFAAGLVAAMILARVIAVETMGTYRQIMYLGPMIVTVFEMGLSATVYRYWRALEGPRRISYAKMLVVAAFALGLAGSLVLALLAAPLSIWYENPELQPALLAAALYPLATIPLMLLRPILISEGYSLSATFLEMAFSLSSIFAIVIPLWLGMSLVTAMLLWTIVCLLRLFTIPALMHGWLRQAGPWWDRSLFREVWAYLWPIQVGRLPGYVMGYLDKVITSIYFSTTAFAIYAMGARELPFIGSIGLSVGNVLVPRLVEDVQAARYEQICRRWRLACEKTAIVTYIVAAFTIIYAAPVTRFMFSATYVESSVPFRVFAALTFIRVIEYGSLAKAFGRSDLIMKSAFIGAGVMIPLAFMLTWQLGAFGMASSILLGTVASAGFLLFSYRRLLDVPLASFFPWTRLLLLLVISLMSAAISAWLLADRLEVMSEETMFGLAWQLGVLFICAGTIYLLFLVLWGFVTVPSVARLRALWTHNDT